MQWRPVGTCFAEGITASSVSALLRFTASSSARRIITPQAVSQLLFDSGIRAAEIIAEDGQQVLQSPDDWWTVVQGSGYRWTLEQMDNETIARVRDINLKTLRNSETRFIETNVIYAVVTKHRT